MRMVSAQIPSHRIQVAERGIHQGAIETDSESVRPCTDFSNPTTDRTGETIEKRTRSLRVVGEKSPFYLDASLPEKLLPVVRIAEGFGAPGAGGGECAGFVAAGEACGQV